MILTLPLVSEVGKMIGVVATGDKWGQYFTDFENPRMDFVPRVYAKLLEDAGLEKQILKDKILFYEFGSQRDIELFLKACMLHVKRLSESKQDEFLSDIVTPSFQAQSSENKLVVSLKMLVVGAIKPFY